MDFFWQEGVVAPYQVDDHSIHSLFAKSYHSFQYQLEFSKKNTFLLRLKSKEANLINKFIIFHLVSLFQLIRNREATNKDEGIESQESLISFVHLNII